MSHSSDLSRRRALQLFSGMPLLPLASSMATLSFATEAVAHGQSVSYTFGGMAAPSLDNPAQMATTSVESTLTLRVGPESKTYPLGYETFFLTGAAVPDGNGGTVVAGGYYDINNQPIVDDSTGAPRQFFSDSPDGMSLLSLSRRERDDEDRRLGRRGSNRVYAVVQFEYTTKDLAGNSRYGRLPSPIAVLSLDQDRRT
ncbi:MAG: alkaline phosphatase, partial [Rubrivivax sp.]|nr:alkaline phosphatase [Rubrivivax sp.]